jgi:P27 family predicted phage terminase small subunit
MGRRSKPHHLKVAEGTYRKDRDNPQKPITALGKPNAPTWLNAESKRIFKQLAQDLYDLSVITPADKYQLALLASEFQQYIQAQRHIQQDGLTLTEPDSMGNQKARKHPAVEIGNTKAKILSDMLDTFGLNPTSKEQVTKAATEDNSSNDPLENHLKN